ncbi:tumor necrosis factor a (TNF superfamily, member 2) [Xiphias gladius]|uniref:tumor necrosis factor a (TNF superfamily, member 2) n=1 Tax=Xiphias gladius TaxID=8245 RepID=UPI001A9A0751|nr:tumor necrosis factor a (TNF superfamily, member 2) [Xiphias gladius]
MEGECKVLLEATVDTEVRKQTMPSVKPSSKLSTALLVMTLCLAAAAAALLVFNMHSKGPGQDEDNFDLRHTLRQISNVRAAIHLEGEYNPEMKTSVEWKNQVDQSHSQGGLELNNNEIVIPQNGLYFVYSQVSFRVSCSSSDTDDTTSKPMVHLSHTVKLWSSSYGNDNAKKSYQTILHSIRTACQKTARSDWGEEGNWFSAVYMGAVFNLRKGDRLKTMMEEKMLPELEDEPGKTFFGVFAL